MQSSFTHTVFFQLSRILVFLIHYFHIRKSQFEGINLKTVAEEPVFGIPVFQSVQACHH